jgi:hypothetical protein
MKSRFWRATIGAIALSGVLAIGTLMGCSPGVAPNVQAAGTKAGQLFCSIQMAGGGSFVAALVATSASVAAPSAGPLIVLATNAGKAAVDADCAKAAAGVAGASSGVAVSPPASPAPVAQVAITTPASPVATR